MTVSPNFTGLGRGLLMLAVGAFTAPASGDDAVVKDSTGVATRADAHRPRVPLLSDAEAWSHLPTAEVGSGQRLPAWARAVARSLPRTTAAMLRLDWIH